MHNGPLAFFGWIAFACLERPGVPFASLDRRQQETLLDFAHTEGTGGLRLRPELVAAIWACDWRRMLREHLYVRYAGHAPDHARNKAFAPRWNLP